MQNSKLNANEIKMATLLELEIYARDVCVCVCVCYRIRFSSLYLLSPSYFEYATFALIYLLPSL